MHRIMLSSPPAKIEISSSSATFNTFWSICGSLRHVRSASSALPHGKVKRQKSATRKRWLDLLYITFAGY